MKHYHHVKLDAELILDCEVWLTFLKNAHLRGLCRPFDDLCCAKDSRTLNFYTDASKAVSKGFGCVFNNQWAFGMWEPGYINDCNPSIEYLELLALCIAIFIWQDEFKNMKVIIFCDNEAVVHMVNNTSAKCRNCMYLIRLLVINNLICNRVILVRHFRSEDILADSLSRCDFRRFWANAPRSMEWDPRGLPSELWPASKKWIK